MRIDTGVHQRAVVALAPVLAVLGAVDALCVSRLLSSHHKLELDGDSKVNEKDLRALLEVCAP